MEVLIIFAIAYAWCKLREKKKESNKQQPQAKVSTIINIPKVSFEPKDFDEYMGQTNVKCTLLQYVQGTKALDNKMPHMLITGKAGQGKTCLGRIITQKYIGGKYYEVIASNIKSVEFIYGLAKEVDGGVIILDEIHSIGRQFAEQFYTLLTDFCFEGEYVKPFTMIGCTTEYGEMVDTMPAFVRRFKHIELDPYETVDVSNILRQYVTNEFPTVDYITYSMYEIVAVNARLAPYKAIQYMKDLIYFQGDIQMLLETNKILKNGYTKVDLKILKYLEKAGKVGFDAISGYLQTSKSNYKILEDYLLSQEMLARTARGRMITDKGIELIKELEEV